jgi:TonB family protein
MPMFEGGENALQKWIYSNVRVLGGIDRSMLKNPVNVVFTVSSTGKISNVRVVKPVHPLLDAEAVRIIRIMPDWLPGKQNGKPVDVIYQLPIDFNPVYL